MKNFNKIVVLFSATAFAAVTLFSCGGPRMNPSTIDSVDLNRYMGLWYEIARFPHSFEKGLVCVTATYIKNADGTVQVINRGHRESDRKKIKEARAKAWVPDPAFPGKLKVQFFWPIKGDYWIIELDQKAYQYAVVAGPSPDYLWILSRTKTIDENLYKKLVDGARQKGFDTDRLIRVDQGCE